MASKTVAVSVIPRHDKYYLTGGDVIFSVDNHLFRVHTYFFTRESAVFRDMLSMPPGLDATAEGGSDDRPIHLPQVAILDFENFLWVFYQAKYEYTAPVEKWKSILSLAHRWQFNEIKELAIREMSKQYMTPIDRAVWARDYDVDRDWHVTAFAALGARKQPLTPDEGRRLGLEYVLQIHELRERIRERRHHRELEAVRYGSSGSGSPPRPLRLRIANTNLGRVGVDSENFEYTQEDLADARSLLAEIEDELAMKAF